MHELAIAQGIITAVRGSLTGEQEARVKRINVTVGEMTALHRDCLEFAFNAITTGTSLEGVELTLEYVKSVFRCKGCGGEFEPEDGFFSPCPDCGGHGVDVVKGNELFVRSVDLE